MPAAGRLSVVGHPVRRVPRTKQRKPPHTASTGRPSIAINHGLVSIARYRREYAAVPWLTAAFIELPFSRRSWRRARRRLIVDVGRACVRACVCFDRLHKQALTYVTTMTAVAARTSNNSPLPNPHTRMSSPRDVKRNILKNEGTCLLAMDSRSARRRCHGPALVPPIWLPILPCALSIYRLSVPAHQLHYFAITSING